MHSLAAAEVSGLGMNSPDICFFDVHVEGNQDHMQLELGWHPEKVFLDIPIFIICHGDNSVHQVHFNNQQSLI